MGCMLSAEYPAYEPSSEKYASSVAIPKKQTSSDSDLEPPRLVASTIAGRNASLRTLRRDQQRQAGKDRNQQQFRAFMQANFGDDPAAPPKQRNVQPLEDFGPACGRIDTETPDDLRVTQQLSEVRAFDGTAICGLSRSGE